MSRAETIFSMETSFFPQDIVDASPKINRGRRAERIFHLEKLTNHTSMTRHVKRHDHCKQYLMNQT